jgi:hypothetical protein
MSIQEIKEILDLANNILVFICIAMATAAFYFLIVKIRSDDDIDIKTSDIKDLE